MRETLRLPTRIYKYTGITAFMLFFFCSSFHGMAQNLAMVDLTKENNANFAKQAQSISGKVTDYTTGEPLPGVNILAEGTTTGTITDIDGNYVLNVSDDVSTLIFSFIGYVNEEAEISGRTVINVSMVADIKSLDEVVVVGYGTKVRRDVTGAISSIKQEEINQVPTASFDQALQGRASGLNVTSSNGIPGAPSRVLIRGTSTISSGSEPLWIIDGMILSNPGGGEISGFARNADGTSGLNPLATLNPNDIESVEVLKDASATAIYGSRGANGVIIVTTKSGKGQGGIDVSMTYGITDVVRGPEEIGFANGPQWLSLVDEARTNRGLPLFDPNTVLNAARDPNAVLTRDQLANTNWFDQVLQQGSFQDINISSSKAGENFNYFLSGNYRNDNGIQVGSNLTRYSTRANVDFQPVNNLKLGTRVNLSYTNQERSPNGGAPSGNTNMATGGYDMANTDALPILPIYHPTVTRNGSPILFDPLSGRNLAASMDRNNYLNDVETYRVLGGLFADYQIPFLKGLSVRSEVSFDYVNTSNIQWGNTVIREASAYAFDFSSTFNRLNYNLYGTYNKTFADIHSLNIVLGVENTEQRTRTRNIEAQELFGTYPEVGAPGDILRVSAGLGNEVFFRGIFGRFDYKLMDKYLLGFSARRDASSIFTSEERWGTFLAASAGWIISEESFMAGAGFVELLKLRASFGQTGNSNISILATQTSYAGWGRYGDTGAGDLLNTIGNRNVTWETTNAYDVGVDYELYNRRISGSIGYFRQDASALLLQVEVPQSTGIFANSPRIWDNIGDIRNEGMEFDITSVNVARNSFKWTTSFNLTLNRNEVVSLTGRENEEIYNVNSNALVTKPGESMGFFRLAEFAGINEAGGYEMIYEMDIERFEETGERVKTGNVIPATRANLQTHLFDNTDKTGLPTYFGGLINNFSYGGFELSVHFSFQGGNYIYDLAERSGTILGVNQLRSDLIGNTWTEENPNAAWPVLTWDRRYDVINEDGTITANERFDNQRAGQVHDRFLKKGDFIRLRTLQLAYNLPSSLTDRVKIRNARVFVSGTNLLTITGYDGYDPEVVQLGGDSQNRNLGQGWTGVQLPQLRGFNFGINLSL